MSEQLQASATLHIKKDLQVGSMQNIMADAFENVCLTKGKAVTLSIAANGGMAMTSHTLPLSFLETSIKRSSLSDICRKNETIWDLLQNTVMYKHIFT
jgi:hypothetical protein